MSIRRRHRERCRRSNGLRCRGHSVTKMLLQFDLIIFILLSRSAMAHQHELTKQKARNIPHSALISHIGKAKALRHNRRRRSSRTRSPTTTLLLHRKEERLRQVIAGALKERLVHRSSRRIRIQQVNHGGRANGERLLARIIRRRFVGGGRRGRRRSHEVGRGGGRRRDGGLVGFGVDDVAELALLVFAS